MTHMIERQELYEWLQSLPWYANLRNGNVLLRYIADCRPNEPVEAPNWAIDYMLAVKVYHWPVLTKWGALKLLERYESHEP